MLGPYVNRHVQDQCSCGLVHVPYDKLIKVLQKGQTPLIDIKFSSGGEIELVIHPMSASSIYIAISHVWSDGLGNPLSNALPRCQLSKIDKYVQSIQDKDFSLCPSILRKRPLFWMDTLCIPAVEEDLRYECINKMNMIYSAAKSVLVLDGALQKIQREGSTSNEILAQILCCP